MRLTNVHYATKVIVPAVLAKALLMTIVIEVVAATTFTQSIILVLTSATATGIFGLAIVLIQVHSERNIHRRIDDAEGRVNEVAEKTQAIVETTQKVAETTQGIAQGISDVQANGQKEKE